jgi:hypothetical protein
MGASRAIAIPAKFAGSCSLGAHVLHPLRRFFRVYLMKPIILARLAAEGFRC